MGSVLDPATGASGTVVSVSQEWSPALQARMDARRLEGGASIGYLPNHIWLDQKLSATTLRVLGVMSMFASGDLLAISQYDLAKRIGVTRQSLCETMAKGVEAGYLQRFEHNGDVVWRMLWLSGFTRQAGPDGKRKVQPDSQAEPDAPRAHAPALDPPGGLTTKTPPVSRTSKAKSVVPFITAEERVWLHARYDSQIGETFVDEQIDLALSHQAAKKCSNWKIYCSNWLGKTCRDVLDTRTAKARLERAKAPYQARTVDEPAHGGNFKNIRDILGPPAENEHDGWDSLVVKAS